MAEDREIGRRGNKDIRRPGYQETGKPQDGKIARKGDQEISEFITKIKTQTSKSLPAIGGQISNSKIQTKYPIQSK